MRPAGSIRFEAFELDPATGELWKEGLKLHLQEKPFQLLAALLEQPGSVVTREELRSKLWPDHTFVDFDHSINVAASKLRETLGDSAENPHFIETLPRRGYRFIAPIAGGRSTAAPSAKPVLLSWVAPLGLLALFGLVLVVNGGWPRSQLAGHLDLEPVESLAVLPFENTSEDPDQEYLADGITAAIIAELGKIRALRVISWQSVVQFKGSQAALPEIAYLLDVDAIVLGGVLRSGDKIGVNAQLVAASPERLLWAESYERDFGDLLDIQQEVARTVAREIHVAVTPEERSRLEDAPPVVPEAYDTYLKGLYHWNRFSKSEFLEAVEYFEEAIALDPEYAAAYSALADTWSMLSWYGHVPPHQGFPKAETAAQSALELAPDLPAALNSMAAVLYCYRWQFSAADKEHQRALQLSPSFALARNWYSWSLADQGRHEDALEEIRRAQRLDPLSPVTNAVVGMRLYDARRYGEAVRQLHLTLEINQYFYPALLFLGRTHQQLGSYEEAVEAFRAAVEYSGGAPIYEAALASGYARIGRLQEAEVLLARLLDRSEEEYVPAFQISTVFLALNRSDEAFEWLERAYEERSPWMTRLAIDPLFDPIRDDDRFTEILRRVGRTGDREGSGEIESPRTD